MSLWQHASPAYFLALGFVCGMAGFRVGWRMRHPVALPVTQAVLGFVPFALAWTAVGPVWAAAAVLAWAAGSTVLAVMTFLGSPAEIDRRVIRAAHYRASMLEWLRTGSGPESRPLATAIVHLRELVLYIAAAVVSANFLSLVLGAILLNYMDAYVAALLRAGRRPGIVLLLGWNVWSLVRVAAYVALGAAAAFPMARQVGYPAPGDAVLALAAAGGAGVVLDLVLKLALSRPCGRILARAVDLGAAAALRPAGDEVSLHLDGDGDGDRDGKRADGRRT